MSVLVPNQRVMLPRSSRMGVTRVRNGRKMPSCPRSGNVISKGCPLAIENRHRSNTDGNTAGSCTLPPPAVHLFRRGAGVFIPALVDQNIQPSGFAIHTSCGMEFASPRNSSSLRRSASSDLLRSLMSRANPVKKCLPSFLYSPNETSRGISRPLLGSAASKRSKGVSRASAVISRTMLPGDSLSSGFKTRLVQRLRKPPPDRLSSKMSLWGPACSTCIKFRLFLLQRGELSGKGAWTGGLFQLPPKNTRSGAVRRAMAA